jgi:adenosylcobinamide hydrolase
MIDKECKFFPCHRGLEDCEFCYCPLYPCKDQSLGEWIIGLTGGKIWDCAKCIKFHGKDAQEKMEEYKKNII